MADVDWTQPTKRKWAFEFRLIPPNKLNDSYGTLNNVDISSVSITEGYYTDTRMQGKMTYYGKNPYRQAYIRIIAKDTTTGYVEELGTFIPTSDDVTMEGSVVKTSVNLESILYGISQQKLQKTWVCQYSDYAKSHLYDIFETKCGFVAGESIVIDTIYSPTVSVSAICDAGSSILELIYGICNASNYRLSVDGHGCVHVGFYVAPSERDATFTITADSADSIVLDGVTRSSNYLEMASQVTVHATDDNSNELTSTKTASGRLSIAQRGYVVGKYYDVSSMTPFTQARADQLASEYLTKATNENMEWTLTTEYMPIRAGDVGYLEGLQDNYGYGTKKKVLVKSRDLDLATMTQKLTLKLASSNDTDTGEE